MSLDPDKEVILQVQTGICEHVCCGVDALDRTDDLLHGVQDQGWDDLVREPDAHPYEDLGEPRA